MNLFTIKGNWTGATKPVVSTITLKAQGQYEWDTSEYIVYDEKWDYKETAPVFHDDGTWSFLVPETNIPPVDTGRKIGKSAVVSFAEALNKSNMRVVVAYYDETGAIKNAEASLLMNPAEFGTINFAPGHSGATYPIFINTGDASFDIEYTIDPNRIRHGARLAIYVEWSDFDTLSNATTKGGMIENILDLDQYVGIRNFLKLTETVTVPNGATRAKFFIMPYNINELDVIQYLIPANKSEVTVKGAGWQYVEKKYIRWISQEDYDALWAAAKAKPKPIDDTRLGIQTVEDFMYGGLVNSTDVNQISGSSGTVAEREAWDAEVFTKIYSGPKLCVAQRPNGTTFGIGNTLYTPIPELIASPLPTDVSKVAIGIFHIAALRPNGTVVHIAPSYATWQQAANSWTGIVDIAAGDDWTAGIKANGSIVVASRTVNSHIDTAAFSGKVLKKIYSMGSDRIIAIDSTGKVLISGSDYSADGFRTQIASWPTPMVHVTALDYKIYAFCGDYNRRQIWCSDPEEQAKVASWNHIVAAAVTQTGLIAIRCDGQIMATEWKSLQIRKKAGYPTTWVATPT